MRYQIVPLRFVLTVEYLDRNDVPLLAYDAEFGDALIYRLHFVGPLSFDQDVDVWHLFSFSVSPPAFPCRQWRRSLGSKDKPLNQQQWQCLPILEDEQPLEVAALLDSLLVTLPEQSRSF